MPLDPAGNFSLVPSYYAEPGTTIKTESHNPPLEDIANVLSQHLVRDGRNGMVGSLNMGSFPITNLGSGVNPTDAATIAQVTGAGPIGTVVDYAGPTAPNSWMLCYGQAVSRTTYAALFAIIGTIYGVGDGSTTFNLPDCRGRVTAGKDDMGGSDAKRLSDFFGALSRTLGGVLGAASHILTLGQLPKHRPTFTGNALPPHDHDFGGNFIGSGIGSNGGYINPGGDNVSTRAKSAGTPSGTISEFGNNEAHGIAQPSIVFNKIIRVSI